MHITHRAKNKQAGLAPLEKIGFTLVEVTIVAGIIITGMVAVQTAVQYGLRAATSNVDGMVAAHLAEEGLELVRNIRDTNWAKDALWDTYMPSTSDGDYQLYYELKTTLPNVPLCSIVTCLSQPLDFDSTSGLYGYNGWGGTFSGSPSRFTRLVNISHQTAGSVIYLKVESKVLWADSMGQRQVSLVENLYDWRP